MTRANTQQGIKFRSPSRFTLKQLVPASGGGRQPPCHQHRWSDQETDGQLGDQFLAERARCRCLYWRCSERETCPDKAQFVHSRVLVVATVRLADCAAVAYLLRQIAMLCGGPLSRLHVIPVSPCCFLVGGAEGRQWQLRLEPQWVNTQDGSS